MITVFTVLFDRQVEALANEGDIVIGISTGGSSDNVISAIKLANELGCKTIGFSGRGGGEMSALCDVNSNCACRRYTTYSRNAHHYWAYNVSSNRKKRCI